MFAREAEPEALALVLAAERLEALLSSLSVTDFYWSFKVSMRIGFPAGYSVQFWPSRLLETVLLSNTFSQDCS